MGGEPGGLPLAPEIIVIQMSLCGILYLQAAGYGIALVCAFQRPHAYPIGLLTRDWEHLLGVETAVCETSGMENPTGWKTPWDFSSPTVIPYQGFI